MGRRRSEISIIPFNQNNETMGGLLNSEAQFYAHD
jgi:hypothetical protein